MTANRLLAPPISLRTTVNSCNIMHLYICTNMLQIPQQDGADSDDISPTATTPTDNAFLSVRVPPSPTSKSLDGETLRSRASSFNSEADTHRSRTNSDISTTHLRYEGDGLTTEEALRPDKANEKDFEAADNPFAYTSGQLNKILNPKSLAAYKALGGIRGLERGLQTDLVAGLSVDETSISKNVSFEEAVQGAKLRTGPFIPHDTTVTDDVSGQYRDRKRIFKDNRLPAKKTLSIWTLFWNAFNDRILILLTAAAVISLALGIYEAVGQPRQPGQPQSLDWVEGLAILVAVVIVVLVTGLNDYRREKQFEKLNAKKEDRQVKAIRSGKSVLISVFDIMAGDVLHLESGDTVPADGVLINGHGIKCDESSATGESDALRKTGGDDVSRHISEGTATNKLDPFIISGSNVLEGVGTYLVTSVGVNSSFGKIMLSLQTENEDTPLQIKLAKMANWIGYLGSSAAGLLFFILLIRFLATLSGNTDSPTMKGSAFLDILIVAVTIIVVAVPEGLPVAVTLALSFATKRMLKENNLVRHLRACETMGNATTICSDKTGTLTQNKMTVVAGTLGTSINFSRDVSPEDEKALSFPAAFQLLSHASRNLLLQSIAINSTAFEGEEDGKPTFIGSKTETALLVMAKEQLGMGPVAEERAGAEVVQLIPFDSNRKCMGVVIKLASGSYRLLVKGAAEIMVSKATKELVDVSAETLDERPISESARLWLSESITGYAQKSLRTIGMLYRDYPQWPPAGVRTYEDDKTMANFEEIFQDMTFLGIVGIQDPLRDGVTLAVKRCQEAGVVVRMVTGDNITTATAIASECGIKTPDGLVMEGPKFRQLSDSEMDDILPHLQVLARSSPEDKRILVARLKHLGETVAVTGDGTNDGPALKTADVGFSMGIAGTEVAKEASAIILMDDNFSSIVSAIMWGRSVNDAVAKFLQFQITVNITAVLLAFVSAVASPDSHSVLSAVQLLWVNLIMDTFAALALATDAPTEKILDRKPTPKRAALITTNMWKMIVGQAVYQLVVTFTLYFAGAQILSYDTAAHPVLQTELDTIIFNTFVWMQIFNEFNNRRLDNHFNIFEGVLKNWFFLGINCVMVGGQIMIVFVGGMAFQIKRIDASQWAICLLCALPCLLWAVVLRCVPDAYAAVVFAFVGKVFFAVFDPLWRGVSAVCRPVRRAWRAVSGAVFAPVTRFVKRGWGVVVRSKKGRVEGAEVDEEAGTGGEVKGLEGRSLQLQNLQQQRHQNLPPITLTTMD